MMEGEEDYSGGQLVRERIARGLKAWGNQKKVKSRIELILAMAVLLDIFSTKKYVILSWLKLTEHVQVGRVEARI